MKNDICKRNKFKKLLCSLSYIKGFLSAWVIYTTFRDCVIKATSYDICYVLNKDGNGGHFENYDSSNPNIGQNGNEKAQNEKEAKDTANVPKEDRDSDNSTSGTFGIAKMIMDLNKGKIRPRKAISACESIRFFEKNSSHFEDFTEESKNEFKPIWGSFAKIKNWFEELEKSQILRKSGGLKKSFSLVEQKEVEDQANLIIKFPDIKGRIVRNLHLYEVIHEYIQAYFSIRVENYFKAHGSGVKYEGGDLVVLLGPHISYLSAKSTLIPFIYCAFDNEQHMILILVNDKNEMCGLMEVTLTLPKKMNKK